MEFETDTPFTGGEAETNFEFTADAPADFGAAEPAEPASGFVFLAQDSAPAPVVGAEAISSLSFGGSSSAPVVEGPNPLAEFNKQFREECDAKDAKEREEKAGRKAAGKAAIKQLLAERKASVEGRKAGNRTDAAAKEANRLAELQGESWGRVTSMIDVHAATEGGAAGTGSSSKKGSKGAEAEPGTDVTRMKDVLITLKNTPLPAAHA